MKTVKKVFTFFAVTFAANVHSQNTMNVKAFVEGFYNETTSSMTAVIDPVANPSLFDTIEVQLADEFDGGILYSERVVFDVNGNGVINVPVNLNGSNCYLSLDHRNSIRTWSANPIVINNGTSYDFTVSQSAAFGANMEWKTNAACLFSGDVYVDGYIDVFDYVMMDNQIQQGAFNYYNVCDLNGDSAVDLLDYVIADPHIQDGIYTINPFFTKIDESMLPEKPSVWPNPASDFINIKKVTDNSNTFSIYNITGNLVQEGSLINQQSRIDIKKLENGLYILKADNDVLKFTVKH